MEGWLAENELDTFIPFDELPRVVNPDKGYIATANNQVAGEDYPYHLSHVWAQPYRYERIAEVLETEELLGTEDMQKLMMDQVNLQAKEFVPQFIEVLENAETSAEAEGALALLADWNYEDAAELPQPLLFHQWMFELENLLYEEIPEPMMEMFSARGQVTDEMLRKSLNGETSIWMEENGGLMSVLTDSLERALALLGDEFGAPAADWAWGDFHRVDFRHPLSGIHPVLEFFLNRKDPEPVGGSGVTPMAASFDRETGIVNHGAPWRFTIDLADTQTGYHINSPGQNGHFRSDWYHDQFDNWVTGDFHATRLGEDTGETLLFVPNKEEE
jgi:penicillin amidase